MEGKAVFGGGQGKGGEADNKLNIDSIIARLLEGEPSSKLYPCIHIILWFLLVFGCQQSVPDFHKLEISC